MDMQMYIAGKWTGASSKETMDVVNPSTGEKIGSVPRGTREDVGRAVEAARKAQPAFGRLLTFERAKMLHKIADAIMARREELGKLLSQEQGKPYEAEALGEVEVAARMYRLAAEDGLRLDGEVIASEDPRKRIFTIRQARGTYGVITPWNFPIAIPSEYLSAGLIMGNSIVWVPAPTTAACAVKLMECIIEAGVPEGVVNLVTGEGPVVGDEVTGHPGIDAIGMTGSSGTGAMVAKRAAGKPQLLELGGNSATIVLADSDVTRAAQMVGRGAFWNAGQICDSTERILVQKSIHSKFIDTIVGVADEFKLGDPMKSGVTLGPVHTARQAQQVHRHIEDAVKKGAKVLTGGGALKDFPTQQFYPATVIDGVKPDMLLNQEETFGPVAPILTFDTEEEAVAMANASHTGLVASLFTNDVRKAFRIAERLQAGMININETSAYWQIQVPFGGYSGKASGNGRLGGKYALMEMSQIKTLIVDIGEPD